MGKTIGSTLTQGAKQVQATVKKATTTTPAVAKPVVHTAKPVVHTTITRPLTQKEKEEKKRKLMQNKTGLSRTSTIPRTSTTLHHATPKPVTVGGKRKRKSTRKEKEGWSKEKKN